MKYLHLGISAKNVRRERTARPLKIVHILYGLINHHHQQFDRNVINESLKIIFPYMQTIVVRNTIKIYCYTFFFFFTERPRRFQRFLTTVDVTIETTAHTTVRVRRPELSSRRLPLIQQVEKTVKRYFFFLFVGVLRPSKMNTATTST